MRILVTGGAGFIGSHLVEALTRRGDAVTVLDNFSTGRRENLDSVDHGRLHVIKGDVRDESLVLQAVRGVDAIVHLAAVASVRASIDDPVKTHAVNFNGTLNLLEAARREHIGRFLFASSAAVYGDNPNLPLSEDSFPSPLSPYASDKLASEHYLSFYRHQYGIQTCPFRFFNIYGPRQDPSSPYSGVISIFAERIKSGQGVEIFGDGEQSRDFVSVADLVRILVSALDMRSIPGAPVNVGTGTGVTLNRLVEILGVIAGRSVQVTHSSPRSGDIRHSRADNARLKSIFGTATFVPLENGLIVLLQSELS